MTAAPSPLGATILMLELGTVIGGKYRILRLMGEGGMGSVYEAEHLVLGSRVALKFLHPEIAQQPNLKQRFLQEARVSATVRDDHIVKVTDVDTSKEGAYLVMELLEGEPLAGLLEREGRLSLERTVHFALQIGQGLTAAHARSIVHRDLKPDNVFVTNTPTGVLLKLLDFGIAKLREAEEYQMTLTRPGAVMGTPEYMAPEQAFGAETVDHKSDIYSLGVMLFEMLTGTLPAHGEDPQEIALRVLNGDVLKLSEQRPDLPTELIHIVERAMSADPNRRQADVAELMRELLPFAPAQDRMSAHSQLPGGYATGLSTPFTPIAVTPLTHEVKSRAELSSMEGGPTAAFPSTLPPEEDGPPAASRLAANIRIKTQSMPEVSSPLSALPRAQTETHGRSAKGGHGWVWVGVLTMLALCGLGGWFYYDRVFASDPTPPQPVPRPTEQPPRVIAAPESPSEPELPPIGEEEPKRPRGSTPPRVEVPQNPPLPQLPPITFPTELPRLPPGLPTELPRVIPTLLPIPGFPAPGLTGPDDGSPR